MMDRGNTASAVRLGAGIAGALALAAGGFAPAVPLAAQETTLGAAQARYDEGFGYLSGVRELPNGMVLVADPLGGVLVRLDPGLTRAERLGGEGEGPGEYEQPDAIWPIGADSSLLVDLGNARLTVVTPDGTLGETSSIVRPGDGPGGMQLAIPRGTDGMGRVYFQGSATGPQGIRDSIEIYRLDRATGDPETVALVKGPPLTQQTSGGPNNQNVQISRIPLGAADSWGVAFDGGVYVARVGDYHVDHIAPNGAVHSGSPVDYRPVGIGTAEKEEWAEEGTRNGGVGISVSVENGRRQVSMGRQPSRRQIDGLEWPDAKPPFVDGRITVDRAGHGWVRRSQPAGEPALYDVFDQTGNLVRSVRMPEDRILLGFGEGTLYAAHIDPLDQFFLEKYAMP